MAPKEHLFTYFTRSNHSIAKTSVKDTVIVTDNMCQCYREDNISQLTTVAIVAVTVVVSVR